MIDDHDKKEKNLALYSEDLPEVIQFSKSTNIRKRYVLNAYQREIIESRILWLVNPGVEPEG